MALYLGSSKKLKIKLSDGNSFKLNIPVLVSTNASTTRLISSDGYILTDSDGMRLLGKVDNSYGE